MILWESASDDRETAANSAANRVRGRWLPNVILRKEQSRQELCIVLAIWIGRVRLRAGPTWILRGHGRGTNMTTKRKDHIVSMVGDSERIGSLLGRPGLIA